MLAERLNYAFDEKLGYLTACPTNVGTGMRVSVMLHLPALVIAQQIEKVFRSLQKMGLAVRGLYGEGSQAMGDFYQISNQVTLGRSEQDLVKQVAEVIPVIIDYERQARAFLVKESSLGTAPSRIGELQVGDTFGELKIVDPRPSTASVVAATAVTAVAIDLEVFDRQDALGDARATI